MSERRSLERAPARTVLAAVVLAGSLVLGLGLHATPSIASELVAQTAESPAGDLSVYQGRWRRIQNEEDEAARLTAIDTAVQPLSWLVRRMAGGILRKTTVPPPEMHFNWDGEHLRQRVSDDNGTFDRPVEPGAAPVIAEDARGDAFSSTWTWAESGIQISWQQHQAHGRNVFRIDTADQTLVVEHTINVTAIDDVSPIVYVSRFGRIGLPAVSAAVPSTPVSTTSSR
ncbi:MAG: hypothetical protein CL908_01220 [Deltaproteobacteria bacterium]|jgi:hypothetical protein|nr:hypothetical protein [Deltaproteobacteria bacterium]